MPHQPYDPKPVLNGKQRPFANPFDSLDEDDVPDWLEGPYSLQDVAMQGLSYAIRAKPDWVTKYKNPEIKAKWRKEALEQNTGEGGLTEQMIDYVLDELEMHERDLQDPSGIRISCFDKVYESDTLIPEDLHKALLNHIAKLEDVAADQQDWHPGSNEQVLDLVHPSLYPLCYNRSLVLKRNEDGQLGSQLTTVSPPTATDPDQKFMSSKYQWLPTDFEVSEDGAIGIKSGYINNLHPDQHRGFYPVLIRLLKQAVPMFERVLSDLQAPPPRRITVTNEHAYSWFPQFDYDNFSGSDEDTAYEKFEESRPITLPAPEGPFQLPEPRDWTSPPFSLRGRTVQVITKVAEIHLSPDKPSYPGGTWHVEGMANENIVSTFIAYVESDNISESRLAFRGSFDNEELPYEQCDYRGVGLVFGIENEGPCLQDYGSLVTQAGRCIAFPNIYQHLVHPFELVDKTKPGKRTIVVFFLCDPLKRIPSTTDVPPQQLEWASTEMARIRAEANLPELPNELWDAVTDETKLMSLEEAKEIRLDLMKERKYLVIANTSIVFQRPFSLCEH